MTSKFKWALTVAMVSILIAGIIGCGGDDGGTTGGDDNGGLKGVSITKEELIQKASEASENLRTSEFEMDMQADINGWDGEEEEEIKMSMSMDVSGAMDIPAQKMRMQIHIDLPEDAQEPGTPENMDIETYLMGDVMYMNMGEMLGGWVKMGVPESELGTIWEQQNWIKQQTSWLLEAYGITIDGERTVNGVDCYEVTMEPDMKQMLDMVGELMGNYMPEDVDPSELSAAADMITEFSAKQWFAKGTLIPIRTEVSMSLEDEGEEVEMNIDMEMNMKYTNINEPVTIEIPEEAEDAVNMGEWSEVMG